MENVEYQMTSLCCVVGINENACMIFIQPCHAKILKVSYSYIYYGHKWVKNVNMKSLLWLEKILDAF